MVKIAVAQQKSSGAAWAGMAAGAIGNVLE
jgi:hypothetical protein